MTLLEGVHANFRTMADRKSLVGKEICYLRGTDIDQSGRGYIFPRYGIVEKVYGRNMEMDNGTIIAASDLVEIVLLGGR